jgi:Domain of unknown function (DUF1929)
MGQRYVQLENTYTGFANNTAVLHVSQVPPNPAILAPGPAFIFVVVNGVPSVGCQVMIGSGVLGVQKTLAIGDLPASQIMGNGSASGGSAHSNQSNSNSGSQHWTFFSIWTIAFVTVSLVTLTV